MTAILSILAVSALFALSAFVAGRRACRGDDCGACHRGCGWFKEKGHGFDRP
jgi:hypothetical protein